MDDLALAREAARAAATEIRRHFGAGLEVELKGDVDPVSAADRAAESAIISRIRSARPRDGILSEESTELGGRSERRWVIDPLDGTVNFLHGVPHVAVSIALEDEVGALVGVVLDVMRSEEFAAVRGSGATLNRRPITVSAVDTIGDAVVATGFPYDRRQHGPAYAEVVGAVLAEARGVRRMGAAALDLAWVACGRVDGYWEFGLAPWDLAAGALLVEEAGGAISDSRGNGVRPADVLATNRHIHQPLRGIIDQHRPAHIT